MNFPVGSLASLCDQFTTFGIEEGGKNQPFTDAVAPDLNEIRGITDARKGITAEEAIFDNSIVSAQREAAEISQRVAALGAKAEALLERDLVESAFKSTLAKHDHALVTACADEMTVRALLNEFRLHNGIKTIASYPPDKLYHFSWLIVAVAIETAFNAVFYEGSAGLLGGAIVALAVSVANMGVAVVLGILFRYVHLPSFKHKLIGYSSLAGFLALGVVLNLIFATFRVQYQILQVEIINSDLSEPTTVQLVEALRVALSEAFGAFQLQFPQIDFMSLLLFFVGFACSIVAFWKGYTSDDRYPGHSEVDREHKAKEKRFLEIKDKAFADAVGEVGRMAQEVDGLRSQILREQMNVAALRSKAQGAQLSFASIIKTIRHELDLVIDTYRASNRAVRTTAAPAYFSQRPSVLPESDGAQALSAFLGTLEAVEQAAKHLADTHGKVLGQKLQQIHQQTNELVQQEFQKVLNDVRTSATRLINQRGHALA